MRKLGLGSGFCRALQFPPPVTTGYSQLRRNMAEKVSKNRNMSIMSIMSFSVHLGHVSKINENTNVF